MSERMTDKQLELELRANWTCLLESPESPVLLATRERLVAVQEARNVN